jgi:type IX secretion system PorP/SprF family membrane protein
MKKQIIHIALLLLLGISGLQAQQDPMFTKYMFNPLSYNPAYAGSAGALDMTMLHRQQWWGIDGAPMTQNLSLHSPIKEKNIGLGLNISLDQIATQRNLNAYASFAYRIPLNSKGTTNLAIGMQGGVSNVAADWTQLEIENPNDPAFQDLQPNLWLPNFGAGLYLHSETWFVGLSSPMLINNKLRQSNSNTIPTAQQYRHYYLTAGGAIPLNQTVVFRPSILIKNVGLFIEQNQLNAVGAPTEFDIDLAFLFNKTFWIGASFRSAFEVINNTSSYDSVDFWASVRLKNGLRIGAAYDYTLTELQGPAQGSYEVLLGYDLIRYVDKVRHVRYF